MENITAYTGAQIKKQDLNSTIFDDFISDNDFKGRTRQTYITNLRQFVKYIALNGITQPGKEDIKAYRNYLEAQGLKPATVTGYLNTVRAFFEWTAASERYPNVAAGVKAPKVDHSTHKKDALEPAEVCDIEHSIDAHAEAKKEAAATAEKDAAGRTERANVQGLRIRAIYLLAVNAGLRTIEISRANICDLETKAGQTYLWIYGKGHSEADTRKPLAHEVAAAIYEYLDARTDEHTANSPLFVSTGNRSGGKRIAASTIGQMLKKAMQEAGYNSARLTAHSLRHTAGTSVQEVTGDIYQTQQYMRHADPKTTEIYLHIDAEKQEAQTAERLYNYYHGQQDTQAADLETVLKRLNPAQLEQLANIAAAMA